MNKRQLTTLSWMLIAIFTMGAFTLLGLVKLMEMSPAVQAIPTETTPRVS